MTTEKIELEGVGLEPHAAWGYTRITGRIVRDGERVSVQVDTETRGEKRLRVFLREMMSASARADHKIHFMSDVEVDAYIEERLTTTEISADRFKSVTP